MIYFLYGEDSFRSKQKLQEIIGGYKKVHKSGLNLIYMDAKEKSFADFYNNFKTFSMFAEKKLIILKNIFNNAKFQEEFLENIKNLEELKDIVVVYENEACDRRTKIFKSLEKCAKAQEFKCLSPAMLKKWADAQFQNNGAKIRPDALDLLCAFVKNDLWRLSNEINKLSNYKKNAEITRQDVELLVRPDIESDIFKTIDALASGGKAQALALLRKHLENGDNVLYLMSMIAYQFRNLLIIKELQDKKLPYAMIAAKSGLHSFVAQKTCQLCSRFSMDQLKKIYRKLFQIDCDIKTGKIEPELALDLLISEI